MSPDKGHESINPGIDHGVTVVGDFEKNPCSSCHFMGENYESGQLIIGKGTNCTDCHGSDPHSGGELPGSL